MDGPKPRRGIALVAAFLLLGAAAAAILMAKPWASPARAAVARVHPAARAGPSYLILGANDLGMHCYQKSYAAFLVLPPANTLKVQVFRHSGESTALVTRGIVVKYRVLGNTYSVGKTDFWDYAADYGFDIKPNVGITGNRLKGKMVLSSDKRYWVATAIPVTPYDDTLKFNPLQLVKVTVRDQKTGALLGTQPAMVLPVSDEMDCAMCHGSTNTAQNILQSHDDRNGTTLVSDLAAGIRHACSECHADNVLGAPGASGVQPLSQAMHGWHASRMDPASSLTTPCYACHPGQRTQCLRGAMAKEGFTCTDCHGDMAHVAQTQAHGRQAWLEEPRCADCHNTQNGENANTLYRNSYLQNGPEGMNGFIMCESCHGSPHAEWPSMERRDNLLPLHVQGLASYIQKCTVCHQMEGGGIHGNTSGD
jgi:hypothetical protein